MRKFFKFPKAHLMKEIFLLSFFSLCLIFLFSSASVFATEPDETKANEDFGWIQIIIEVPEGFSEAIVVCVENLNDGREFAALVTKAEEYETLFQVPSGEYSFIYAFLENTDFHYITSLVSSNSEFVVSAELDTPPLLELKTTLLEASEEAKPSTEATVPNETKEATKGTETDTEPSEDSTEATDDPTTPAENNTPEEEALSTGKNLLWGLFSTMLFGGLVFLGVFLYRKHYVAI